MFGFLRSVYAVSWSDACFMKHHALDIAVSTLMSPLLYVLVFGYGVSSYISTDGDISYLAIVVPGISAMTSLSASFSSTSGRLNVQRLYYSCFDELMLCPVSASAMVVGKALMGVLRGLSGSIIIFCIGLFLAPELMLTPLFLVSILISCFTFSFLGIAAALMSKTHQSMATFSSLVILPMTFLCGTFFSISDMDTPLQWVFYIFPLSHSTETARASALGLDFPWVSLIILTVFGIAFFLLNVYLIKSKKV
ncbi:MAG: ABC transporter permease [Candidatus Methanoplasma sp.]|jgi:ABC-type multidrug transport system permease subunit|nr:ABC transporter permease [Candidatus Methanoplasma sp.]